MFYHVKDLQFNTRVSLPDPYFATLLLDQFGGADSELKSAMQYFIQAFGIRQSNPDIYDLLMDIATEELNHLEIVGTTIQLLVNETDDEMQNITANNDILKLIKDKPAREKLIHDLSINPRFLTKYGRSPALCDARGNPWSADYINTTGELSVDLLSNMSAESRAKFAYEDLLQFTTDPFVKETLQFLITREDVHYQQFQARLYSLKPNFPQKEKPGDSRDSHNYFNYSNGTSFKGPWNEGISPGAGESWEYIDDPLEHVLLTNGLIKETIHVTERTISGAPHKERTDGKHRTEKLKDRQLENALSKNDTTQPQHT